MVFVGTFLLGVKDVNVNVTVALVTVDTVNLLVDFSGADGHASRVLCDEAYVRLRVSFRHT